MDIDKEKEALDYHWPAIHAAGIDKGWRGVAEAAWNFRATFASQDTAPPAAVPAPDKLEAFEKWARSHGGLSLESRSSMECENGWFPATYWSAMTEIAWRAFANAPASHQAAAPAQAVDALAEFAPYLKDGETPLERLNREIADSNALTSLLANERRRLEFLHSVNKDAEGYEYGIAKVKFSESGQIESFLWALSDGSDIDAALAAQPAAPENLPVVLELPECDTRTARVVWQEVKDGKRHLCIAVDGAAPAGEPVAWLESEESARKTPIKEVMRGMFHTAVWHFSERPQTSNPVWTLHAPVANTSQKVAISGGKVASEHATLGGQAQAVAVPDGWKLSLAGDDVHITDPDGRWCGYTEESGSPARSMTWRFLRAILAAAPLPQQVAQKDGDPK